MTDSRYAAGPWRRAFPPAFWAAALFSFVMATLPHTPALDEVGDKYQHMLAFGVMTALAALAFPASPLPRLGERLSFFGAMIELVQSIPALHRDCDIRDWVADTASVVVVLLVVAAVRRRAGAAQRPIDE